MFIFVDIFFVFGRYFLERGDVVVKVFKEIYVVSGQFISFLVAVGWGWGEEVEGQKFFLFDF